ncbi:MAG: zinc ribbon domain-containing protein [Candidatus Sigynarchaeota archaeon]
MTSKCASCGFTSDDQDARFCPNCGGALETVAAPPQSQPAPATGACPNCGSTVNAPGSRFCQSCGTPLGGGQAAPAVTPAVTPAAVSPAISHGDSGPKRVTGMKIKMMPIARHYFNGMEESGLIELHSDGIIFYGKHMAIMASLHVSDIARADPGAKSNLLDVRMKDGSVHSFKFMNARDWAGIINTNIK